MAIVAEAARVAPELVAAIQAELRRQKLGGWLLASFRGSNPVASALLGIPALSRRYFVLIPATSAPIAITHRIEQQPWREWQGENRPYLGWRELETELARLLGGRGKVAVEFSPEDEVPYVDLVPAGVLELLRRQGAEIVSSADLVTLFHARWSPSGEASHHRAARIVQETAHAAFARIGEKLTGGEPASEWEIREWIVRQLAARGLRAGADATVAIGRNAANPHYGPTPDSHAQITPGSLVLIDLWGKEDAGAIFADQTWMGFAGEQVPPRIQQLWEAVRDARQAAEDLVIHRFSDDLPVRGAEVDDAARAIISGRGYGDFFIHRTGHSIDRELHGTGPNIDNLETRDTRLLVPGIGFSIEPGIYIPGEAGLRSETNMYIGEGGPVVTTPNPQQELIRISVPSQRV